MTAPFTSLGNLSIDDLVFVDGTTQWAVPGGNAVYAALGMSVWGERPRVIAPFGPDYPVEKLEGRLDLSACPRIPRTLRDWGLYEEDGSRQFIFRSTTQDWDDFSPRPSDVAGEIPAAHLAPLPWERHVSLIAALREAGTRTISIDLDDRKLAAVSHAAVADLIRSVDLFMPSRQDGRVIFPKTSPADTVRRFRDMAPDTKLIVLNAGRTAASPTRPAAGTSSKSRPFRSRPPMPPGRATPFAAARSSASYGLAIRFRRCSTALSRPPTASRRSAAPVFSPARRRMRTHACKHFRTPSALQAA